MKAIHALTATAAALTLAASALPAQDTVPPATRPRARMGIHPPGTGLQPGVTPLHQRLGFNQSARGVRGMGVGYGLGLGQGQGQCCAPGGLLAQRSFLGLTDEQVAQLQGLNTELTEAQQAAMDQVRTHQQELDNLWAADQPDANAIRQRSQQLMQAQQDAQLAAVDATARSRAILSAEQQGKVQGFAQGQRLGLRQGVGMRGSRYMPQGRMGVGRGSVGRGSVGRQGRGVRRAPRPSRRFPPQIQ